MAGWRDAAAAMYIPYDTTLGVHPQASGFTGHEMWDFDATTDEQYPLLLHFPYLDLYRKQVVKQADLVLAMLRCGDAFTAEQKARNFDYYERITVRDSSLSSAPQAVLAAEVGQLRLAYDYVAEAALMDLDDLEHNTRDGLHVAALAGTWIALVNGLAGMRHRNGNLLFAPRLPDGLTQLGFTIVMRGSRLRVRVDAETATYTLTDGRPLPLLHYTTPITVSSGSPVACPIPVAPSPTTAPPQPRGREPARRRLRLAPDGLSHVSADSANGVRRETRP
jgi:alpha,alpha-trehalose phosphorylase